MTTLDRLTDKKKRPAMYAVIGLGVSALVVWMIWMSVALLGQARTNAGLSDQILDCTKPPGECFQRGEDRYATAVSGINAGTLRIIAAALACQADGITAQKPLADCTAERAAKSAPKEN